MFHVIMIAGAVLTAVSAQAQQTATNRWDVGARGGVGLGGYSNVIDENCPRLIGNLDITCGGDDSGPTWLAGLDARWMATDRFDIGVRGGVTKLPKIVLEASGNFEGIEASAAAEGSGYLWSIGAEGGVRATPRLRLYGGAGVSVFTFDSTLSLTAFGITQSRQQDNSGLGPILWGGVEWTVRDRWSIFGEGARTSLKDDDVADDEEPFEEAFISWMVGVRVNLGARR